jgi:predicted nucleotidyltransferase
MEGFHRADRTGMIEQFEGDTLVTTELLRAITRRIVEAVHPDKIILFGSYAYGTPTLDSDIDLLVVMKNHLRPIENARAIDKLFLHRRFGMDILVRTSHELRRRLVVGDMFMQEITERGQVLYDRQRGNGSRLGRQGGNGLRRRIGPRAAAQRIRSPTRSRTIARRALKSNSKRS